MQTLIKDIRMFESDSPNVDSSFPSYFGTKIYCGNVDYVRICTQFALKLREYDFHFYDFNHLYINCSTILPENEVQKTLRSKDKYHLWYKFVEYGLNKKNFINLSHYEMKSKIIDIIESCLKFVALNEKDKKNIEVVAKDIKRQDADLEIIYKQVQYKEQNIKIIIKILNSLKIEAFVSTNSKKIKLDIVDLDALYQALGKIKITKNQVIILPKQNSLLKNPEPIKVTI